MNDINNLRFILHVSDFHLNDNDQELMYVSAALETMTEKLKSEKIKVDYLVHTGDIIDSGDLHEKTAAALMCEDKYYEDTKEGEILVRKFKFKEFELNASIDEKKLFNEKLVEFTKKRFSTAEKVMRKFISDLNISFGNVVICCGNHDVLRPLNIDEKPVTCAIDDNKVWQYNGSNASSELSCPFEDFLNRLEVANSKARCKTAEPVTQCTLGNIKMLILNTNWKNPKDQKPGYYCVHCEHVRKTINENNENSENNNENDETLKIVVAHKPIYEICEKARLSYKRYIKTSFMSDLQKFVGDKGVYLCGDKHTRSITGSLIHDIPHYIGGEPLKGSDTEVEYNLLEISKCQVGIERKIHLTSQSEGNWVCGLRPQDSVVSKLYRYSQKYIKENTFENIDGSKSIPSWESVCQEIYSWDKSEREAWHNNLNNLYQSICKYRIFGKDDALLQDENIFWFLLERLKSQMNCPTSQNVLNIRGEYSSGKSTFLGLLYIFLLYQYSIGTIDFIPAYFNLESDKMSTLIEAHNGSYYDAVQRAFTDFTKQIQKIADKEHQSVCYIIDELDEQDCWSYSTEDSVGRGLLDILARYKNARYIISFSQHRLPCLKNTMPARKYNDTSDIMYFNPIHVREKDSEDNRFVSFVGAFLKSNKTDRQRNNSNHSLNMQNANEGDNSFDLDHDKIEAICDIIRNFRRLTINPGFMYQNYEYITAIDSKDGDLQHKAASVTDIYRYYIDRQHELCLDRLGYGFIHYAPAMAYLFAYKGYTYERFKRLHGDNTQDCSHTLKSIRDNYNKVYQAFTYIRKHQDAREYLIALHYNRELRYYAEHIDEKIEEDSILNEFITRNISVIVRKLWTDTNKFIIVCEKLLQRDELSNNTQSMLIYCLAHLKMYAPIRDHLYNQMREKAEATLSSQGIKDEGENPSKWNIQGEDNKDRLMHFINLGLLHSLEVFKFMDSEDSVALVNSILSDDSFFTYNRQFQMLYYGDLSILGEETKRALIPGKDIIYKGFDFHNCFNYLYVKLSSKHQYRLREIDMFTMGDLILSRLKKTYRGSHSDRKGEHDTFFYRDTFNEKSLRVLEQAKTVFGEYLAAHKENCESKIYKFFKQELDTLEKEIQNRTTNGSMHEMIQLVQKLDNSDA